MAKSSATPAAFFDIPLSLIIVAAQIRSRIDQEGEAFLALVESIGAKGVLESVIVTPRDGKYLLIAGERRLLACRKLGAGDDPGPGDRRGHGAGRGPRPAVNGEPPARGPRSDRYGAGGGRIH